MSLLEVLIAALVLSIGLLGLAGLQTHSLRFNHGAYARSQANILANDIIDRMRTNATAAKAGQYDIDFSIDNANACGAYGDPSVNRGSSSLADFEQGEWKNALACILPSGDGRIASSSEGSLRRLSVTVQWRDPGDKEQFDAVNVETLL